MKIYWVTWVQFGIGLNATVITSDPKKAINLLGLDEIKHDDQEVIELADYHGRVKDYVLSRETL